MDLISWRAAVSPVARLPCASLIWQHFHHDVISKCVGFSGSYKLNACLQGNWAAGSLTPPTATIVTANAWGLCGGFVLFLPVQGWRSYELICLSLVCLCFCVTLALRGVCWPRALGHSSRWSNLLDGHQLGLLGLRVATLHEPQTNSNKFFGNSGAPRRGSYSYRLRVCLCSPDWPPPSLLPSFLFVCLLFSFDLWRYQALSLQQHVITPYGAFPTDSMMSGDSVRCIYNLSQAGGQSNTSLAN